MERKVQKIKSSYQIVIPKQFADMLRITPGTMMNMAYENGKIIMDPKNADKQVEKV
jgi:AbrB family looped-hinge helix DNA binding protein